MHGDRVGRASHHYHGHPSSDFIIIVPDSSNQELQLVNRRSWKGLSFCACDSALYQR